MDVGYKVISSYERSLLKGSKKSKGDALKEEQIVKTTLKAMLSQKVDYELDDGTSVIATPLELIIGSAINDAIKNGSFKNVEIISRALNESDLASDKDVNLNISLIDKEFEKKVCR